MRASARVLAMRAGNVLLVGHTLAERWELPGGGVEPVETLVEGVTRECWEVRPWSSPAPTAA
ncbi:MAG: NUDIX domain-containing protein [Chloroflexota bacterium]